MLASYLTGRSLTLEDFPHRCLEKLLDRAQIEGSWRVKQSPNVGKKSAESGAKREQKPLLQPSNRQAVVNSALLLDNGVCPYAKMGTLNHLTFIARAKGIAQENGLSKCTPERLSASCCFVEQVPQLPPMRATPNSEPQSEVRIWTGSARMEKITG